MIKQWDTVHFKRNEYFIQLMFKIIQNWKLYKAICFINIYTVRAYNMRKNICRFEIPSAFFNAVDLQTTGFWIFKTCFSYILLRFKMNESFPVEMLKFRLKKK